MMTKKEIVIISVYSILPAMAIVSPEKYVSFMLKLRYNIVELGLSLILSFVLGYLIIKHRRKTMKILEKKDIYILIYIILALSIQFIVYITALIN